MNGKGRQAEWQEVVAGLPRYLEALLACEAFGRGPGRKPPPLEHGVYLFTEAGRPLYVGRCGLTERAAKKGAGHSNFRTRLAGHSRPSSGHNQATFASRLRPSRAAGKTCRLPGRR
jgi:hypothetical protein